MSDFKESIKKPTDEQKKSVLVDVLFKIINSPRIMSPEAILRDNYEIRKILSQDEFTVIYNLAVQIRGKNLYNNNKKFLESLDISGYCENDNGYLLRFIKTATEDIELTRKLYPKENKWELNINKIFARMEGNKPDEKDIATIITQANDKQVKNIINLNDYRN